MENNLFDPARPHITRQRGSKLARRADPATSHMAAENVEPKLNALQQRFARAVAVLGTATAAEAADAIVNAFGIGGGNRESYRKRAVECLRAGVVRIDGTRRCRITGKIATVYRAAEPIAAPPFNNALGVR